MGLQCPSPTPEAHAVPCAISSTQPLDGGQMRGPGRNCQGQECCGGPSTPRTELASGIHSLQASIFVGDLRYSSLFQTFSMPAAAMLLLSWWLLCRFRCCRTGHVKQHVMECTLHVGISSLSLAITIGSCKASVASTMPFHQAQGPKLTGTASAVLQNTSDMHQSQEKF